MESWSLFKIGISSFVELRILYFAIEHKALKWGLTDCLYLNI